VTLVFTLGTAVVLLAVGAFVYRSAGDDLLSTVDAGLSSRAELIAQDVRTSGPSVAETGAHLIEADEAFAQVADASGGIVQSSSIVAGTSLLAPSTIRAVERPTFFDRSVVGIDNTTRIIAVPVRTSAGHSFVLVGASLQDRRDELLQLAATLGVGGAIALLLIAAAGWLLAGAILRPVEEMQREASEITSSDLGRRLTPPLADDEISRLGKTLNAMLDRIEESFVRERRFVDNASHELRTPVAILKAELDLALSRARTNEELETALRSAAEETDHLARLAEDLLVLSRANDGGLAIQRTEVDLPSLVQGVVRHFEPRAAESDVRIEIGATPAEAFVDPVRLRQALDDLLDNAVRHTQAGGVIRVSAERNGDGLCVRVEDKGDGFPEAFLPSAFEAFSRSDGDGNGAGLGLAIVRAIAEAHGGSADASNGERGGAVVTIALSERP
jgi:two-component system OmpR family sensor kinase